MLTQLLQKNHVVIADGFSTWTEAIYAACQPLEATGAVTAQYAKDIITSVQKYGAYIVIAPLIALPHAQHSESVYRSAVSFLKTHHPVVFDVNNQDKNVQLFFTLASADSSIHLANLSALATMLENETLINELLMVRTQKDVWALAKKYGI